MFNFLGLIGWSLDDHTVLLSRDQFVQHFDLDRVVKSPALFDLDKLNWMNGQYIQRLPPDEFAALATEWLERDLPACVPRPLDAALVRGMAEALQTRVKRLDEVEPLARPLFLAETLDYDAGLLLGKKGAADPVAVTRRLALMRDALASLEPWDRAALESLFDRVVAESGVKKGDLLAPLRVAVTGSTVSLPMDVTLTLLGRDRALARIDDAIMRLSTYP